MELVHK